MGNYPDPPQWIYPVAIEPDTFEPAALEDIQQASRVMRRRDRQSGQLPARWRQARAPSLQQSPGAGSTGS
ncbi:hypothetical protein [Wenzhouxiangella limi]|uniref:Uncharacterized protein n=1 Tax=Wenzhouxiangella limi TaxID=2707351 RepID=A0A845V8Q5_9GAMM|nr:hypothetical protein [Wenzhouxiangella limi]NDY96541.1 hypothetical protein [Wenzhouxiangella limi]